MKLINSVHQMVAGKHYVFYHTSTMLSDKYVLLIEGRKGRKYTHHCNIADSGFLLDSTHSGTYNHDQMYKYCDLYELDDVEFNKHIVVDNL